MISIQIMGGFGNQLFQIFAAFAYCIHHNVKLVIPYHCNMGHRKTYWDSFFREIVMYTTQNPENKCNEEMINGFKVYREMRFMYDPFPDFQNDSVCLIGYFQSYKYFEPYQEIIFKILKIEEKKQEVLGKYPELFDSSGDIVSIHFRLGDYKEKRYYHPIMNYEYFEESLGFIMRTRGATRVLYICEEEDNDYVESKIELLRAKYPIEYVKVPDSIPDYEQLLIMACCHHNVISNSSFSWWGAYLNRTPSKAVCYPSVWFGEYYEHIHDHRDMLPDTWKKIVSAPVHWNEKLT
jgi:hypothetical protein